MTQIGENWRISIKKMKYQNDPCRIPHLDDATFKPSKLKIGLKRIFDSNYFT